MTVSPSRLMEVDPAVRLIGVVSDTHIPTRGRRLPAALFRKLKRVELILHAGDLVEESVLEALENLAPVYAVAGNMDPARLARRLGERLILQVGATRIGLVHGHGSGGTTRERARAAFAREDPPLAAVVFGHSHQPYNATVGSVLLFNPGSAVDPRRMPRPSCGHLHITGKDVIGEIIYF